MNGTTLHGDPEHTDSTAMRKVVAVVGTVLAFAAALGAGVLLVFVVAQAFGSGTPPAVDPIELVPVPATDG